MPLRTKGLLWPGLLLAWIVVSPLWSSDPATAMPKAVALLACSLAAWRMTTVVTVEEMFTCIFYTVSALLVVSLALVIFIPSIGVVQHEWQHIGNWKGMFGSKQGLGMVSAIFTGIVLLRLVRQRTLFDAVVCGVGLVCLLYSGSRGAGVMAVVAVACLVITRGNPKLASIVTFLFLADLLVVVAEFSYLYITGRESFLLFGYDINFTERTFIWQYLISVWPTHPYFGFGLNGFWTDENVYYAFKRLHGWVLDNDHSGYLTILLETGVVGFTLFSVVVVQLVFKLKHLMANVRAHRFSLEMAAVFLIMFFTINMTETFFLRSTNFVSTFFTFLVTKILSTPNVFPVPSVSRFRKMAPGLGAWSRGEARRV